jgi:hypothetical protein
LQGFCLLTLASLYVRGVTATSDAQGNNAAAAQQAHQQAGAGIDAGHAELAQLKQLAVPAAVRQAAALLAFVRIATTLNTVLMPVQAHPIAAVGAPLPEQAQQPEQLVQDGEHAVQVVLQS